VAGDPDRPAAGIDPQQRAEAVAPERYVALSNRLAAQAA